MPVLLLQPEGGAAAGESSPTYRRVLVPLDGSAFSEEVLAPARAFAGLHDAEVRLIHVVARRGRLGVTHPDPVTDRPGEKVDVIGAAGVTEGILDAARAWGADLLAIATHGRGGLSRMLVGSTASDLLARTQLPVLLHRPVASVRTQTEGPAPSAFHRA
jgi:nucleotide-binding universal stress UspA family protein